LSIFYSSIKSPLFWLASKKTETSCRHCKRFSAFWLTGPPKCMINLSYISLQVRDVVAHRAFDQNSLCTTNWQLKRHVSSLRQTEARLFVFHLLSLFRYELFFMRHETGYCLGRFDGRKTTACAFLTSTGRSCPSENHHNSRLMDNMNLG
jgi:hypothetical protein